MRPLKIQLTEHTPALSQYSRLSNLKRIAGVNHAKWLVRNEQNTYFLPNENSIVQLLSLMGINPEWSFEYLAATIAMQYDNWASMMNITCVLNKGKVKTDLYYGKDSTELLVALPPLKDYVSYLKIPENLRTPIVPLYSTETDIDYIPINGDKDSVIGEPRVGITGIDLAALAIGYWQYLNERISAGYMTGLSPHYYAAGVPFINAKILQHQLSFFNSLYAMGIEGKPLEDCLIQNNKDFSVNPIEDIARDYLDFLHISFTTTPSRSVEHFVKRIVPFIPLDKNVLDNNPGKYESYSVTNAIWQLPVIKIISCMLHYNNQIFSSVPFVLSEIKIWARQDIEGMIRQYIPKPLAGHYKLHVSRMLDLVKDGR